MVTMLSLTLHLTLKLNTQSISITFHLLAFLRLRCDNTLLFLVSFDSLLLECSCTTLLLAFDSSQLNLRGEVDVFNNLKCNPTSYTNKSMPCLYYPELK